MTTINTALTEESIRRTLGTVLSLRGLRGTTEGVVLRQLLYSLDHPQVIERPDSSDAIKVTVSDPATGDVLGERMLTDDVAVICAGSAHVSSMGAHANGTQQYTIRGVRAK